MDMIDQFEKYTNGDLSSEELKQFEAKLSEDSLFREEFDKYRHHVLGIEAFFLKDALQKHTERQKNKDRPTGFKMWWILIAVIALTITAILVWQFSSEKKAEPEVPVSFASYFEADPGLPTTMGATDQLAFHDAMVDYKKGKYQSSIEKWKELSDQNPENDTLSYYIGNAHQALNQNEEALTYYKRVLNLTASSFNGKTLFRLAIIEAEKGNTELAISYLQKSDHPKAEELINRLSEF